MAHRTILTERQRAALFDLPTTEVEMLRHYILADDDIEHIQARRRQENRIGYALQLCVLRYPGRLLTQGEVIPDKLLRFIGAQLGITSEALLAYAARRQTRQEHLEALRAIYGYKMFTGRGARDLKVWLTTEAEAAFSNEDLARRFVAECRRTQTILPGVSVIERLCADALVAAERKIEACISERLDAAMRAKLDAMLSETVEGGISRFIWLRQFEVGKNSAYMNRLLDRLEHLQGLGLSQAVLKDVLPHRVTRIRRQGERYFTHDLRDVSDDRRLAILAACAVEWQAAIADAVVETHDRIVGKTWNEAKARCDVRIADAKTSLHGTLRAFSGLGAALLEARGDAAALEGAIATACGWQALEGLVATADQLTVTMVADALAHVGAGYYRFRRYAPRMLRMLDIQAAPVTGPCLRQHNASSAVANSQRQCGRRPSCAGAPNGIATYKISNPATIGCGKWP